MKRFLNAWHSLMAARRETWFWVSLVVTVALVPSSVYLIGEAIKAWNQPATVQVSSDLQKTGLSESDYQSAAKMLAALIARNEAGDSVLQVHASSEGITITGAKDDGYETFINALYQVQGALAGATWEFAELCLGSGCSGGRMMARVTAVRLQVGLKTKN